MTNESKGLGGITLGFVLILMPLFFGAFIALVMFLNMISNMTASEYVVDLTATSPYFTTVSSGSSSTMSTTHYMVSALYNQEPVAVEFPWRKDWLSTQNVHPTHLTFRGHKFGDTMVVNELLP